MQQAMQIQTVVNDAIAASIPELRPLLGHRIQVVALDLGQDDTDRPELIASFEHYLATRQPWPADRPPLTLEEMEEAIKRGACASADL